MLGLLCLTIPAQGGNPIKQPVNVFGRPVRDAKGEPINYSRADSLEMERSRKSVPIAKPPSSKPHAFIPTQAGTQPFWQYARFGSGIGLSNIIIAPAIGGSGPREIIIGGDAATYWGLNDFWQVLRWNASRSDYDQVFVSPTYSAGIKRLVLGNLIGDSNPEIAVMLVDGRVYLYDAATKQELGFFNTGVSALEGACLADLDGDSYPEIVVTTLNDLFVFDRTGQLLWQLPGAGGLEVVVGQLDNDSALEIATTSGKVIDASTHTVQWTSSEVWNHLKLAPLPGAGYQQIIAAEPWYYVDAYDIPNQQLRWSIRTPQNIAAIEVADVDGDGIPEVIIGDEQWGTIHVHDLVTRVQKWAAADPEPGATDIAVGDVDNDGVPDLLWGAGYSSSGPDYLCIARTTGTHNVKWQNVDLGGPFLGPLIGDLDGDGKSELVVTSFDSSSNAKPGRILVFDLATLTLRAMSAPVTANHATDGIRDLKLCDLEGDGRMEIAVATDYGYYGAIEIYGFDTANTFTLKWSNTTRPDSAFTQVEVADLDGNGVPEIIGGTNRAVSGLLGVYLYIYDYPSSTSPWLSFLTYNYTGVTGLVVDDLVGDGTKKIAALVSSGDIYTYDASTRQFEGLAPHQGALGTLLNHRVPFGLIEGDTAGAGHFVTYSGMGTYTENLSLQLGSGVLAGVNMHRNGELWTGVGNAINLRIPPGYDSVIWQSSAVNASLGRFVATDYRNGQRRVFSSSLHTVEGFLYDSPQPPLATPTPVPTPTPGTIRPENILVSISRPGVNEVKEFTFSGSLVQTIPFNYNGGFYPATEYLRDIAVTPEGSIAGYNGTLNPYLTRYSIFRTFSHSTIPGWSTSNVISYGGIAAYQNFVYLTDTNTSGGAPNGIVRFDTSNNTAVRFASGADFVDLNMGLDGTLYAISSGEATIKAYDPITLTLLRNVFVGGAIGGNVRSLAVDQQGRFFICGGQQTVFRVSSTGTLEASKTLGFTNLNDIDIDENGNVIVAQNSGGPVRVFVGDSSLTNFTSFTAADQASTIFTCFARPVPFSLPPPLPTATPSPTSSPSPTPPPTATPGPTPTPSPTPVAIIRVPIDQPTIQQAINAASNGYIILVSPGTYLERIDYNGKAIAIRSTNGPEQTTIDGAYSGTVVTFANHEGPQSILDGFTIEHGNETFGAGISSLGSSPTIIGNIFRDNIQQSGGCGAAICGNGSSPLIERNTFQTNSCDTQSTSGVVAFVNTSNPRIMNNVFVGNPCVAINLVSGNHPVVANNTIAWNSLGIRLDGRSSAAEVYANNILFQNDRGVQVDLLGFDQNPIWTNNLVLSQTTNYTGIPDQTGQNGNVAVDPRFVSVSSNYDFRLLPNSPVIDAGTISVPNFPSTDFLGRPRVVDGNGDGSSTPDMGAYEFDPGSVTATPTPTATPAPTPTATSTPMPDCDTWTPTTTINAPIARTYHTAVWTDSEMIVWGGYSGTDILNTGGRYDPATNTWRPTSTLNAPAARDYHTAVWTGTEMIVWGGTNGSIQMNTGGRYNPVTNTWTPTSTVNAPTARVSHTAVWTGTEMIVWGGGGYLNTGGKYNPVTDTWTAMSTVGAPLGRFWHTAVWTGSEMIVWSGYISTLSWVSSGGRYNPATNTWIATTSANAPDPRKNATAVWTGNDMIGWGGYPNSNGAKFNPTTGAWTPINDIGAPRERYIAVSVWTGNDMIVWGGTPFPGSNYLNTGGRYNPGRDSWRATSLTNSPTGRSSHTGVWTGGEMIVWGGVVGSGAVLNTGGKYCVQPAPTPIPTATPDLAVNVALPVESVDLSVTTFTRATTTSTINAADRLIGFQGDFSFDSSVVSFQNPPVAPGGLTADNWNVSGNVLPGEGPIKTLRVSAFSNDGTTPLFGSGVLFNLNLTRVSSVLGKVSGLIWAAPADSFLFVDADLNLRAPTNTSGQITVVPTLAISGRITRCGDSISTGVAGVTLTLTGSSGGTSVSDSSGSYSLLGLTLGGSYQVRLAKSDLPPSSSEINTVDAIAVQRHYLSEASLLGCSLLSADATGDTDINTLDVVAIQRFFIGRTFGTGNVGHYQFNPASRTYPAISGNQTGQDYDALVIGDVISPAARP